MYSSVKTKVAEFIIKSIFPETLFIPVIIATFYFAACLSEDRKSISNRFNVYFDPHSLTFLPVLFFRIFSWPPRWVLLVLGLILVVRSWRASALFGFLSDSLNPRRPKISHWLQKVLLFMNMWAYFLFYWSGFVLMMMMSRDGRPSLLVTADMTHSPMGSILSDAALLSVLFISVSTLAYHCS